MREGFTLFTLWAPTVRGSLPESTAAATATQTPHGSAPPLAPACSVCMYDSSAYTVESPDVTAGCPVFPTGVTVCDARAHGPQSATCSPRRTAVRAARLFMHACPRRLPPPAFGAQDRTHFFKGTLAKESRVAAHIADPESEPAGSKGGRGEMTRNPREVRGGHKGFAWEGMQHTHTCIHSPHTHG